MSTKQSRRLARKRAAIHIGLVLYWRLLQKQGHSLRAASMSMGIGIATLHRLDQKTRHLKDEEYSISTLGRIFDPT